LEEQGRVQKDKDTKIGELNRNFKRVQEQLMQLNQVYQPKLKDT
jgi:hypothetical protein